MNDEKAEKPMRWAVLYGKEFAERKDGDCPHGRCPHPIGDHLAFGQCGHGCGCHRWVDPAKKP